ncbi:hypothetical protein OSTOST_20238 [Ostertagia ostertagi]
MLMRECRSDSFRFLLTNYNLTDAEIYEINQLNKEAEESWTHEEVQMVVLSILLLVVIFTFIAVAGMDCFVRRCSRCLGPFIVTTNKRESPPPYTPPSAYTKSITHIDHDPPQYNTTHVTHVTIS